METLITRFHPLLQHPNLPGISFKLSSTLSEINNPLRSLKYGLKLPYDGRLPSNKRPTRPTPLNSLPESLAESSSTLSRRIFIPPSKPVLDLTSPTTVPCCCGFS
jgi:hypothetical protein